MTPPSTGACRARSGALAGGSVASGARRDTLGGSVPV
jgi:hypothetical protein